LTRLRRHAVVLLGALVLLVFVGATGVSGYGLVVQRDLLDRVDRGATFAAVQLEREYVKLGEAVATYWAIPGAAERENLLLRLDLFWSRYPILLTGSEGEAIRRYPGNLERLRAGEALLPDLEAAVLALSPGDRGSLDAVRSVLDAYRAPVTEISRTALQIDNYEATIESLIAEHATSFYLYLVVAAAGAALLLVLRGQVARARAFAARAVDAEGELRRRVAAIEASQDGVALLDAAGRFTYVNAAHAAIYGRGDPADLVGRPWRVLYPREEAERIAAELIPALEATGQYRGEGQGRRADGTTFPQEVAITRLDDGDLVCIVRDISERKAAEVERAQLREQRFRSQKLEAIGRLAGGIAHDFNNILAAIIGYADFLVEDLPRGSEARGFAGQIRTAGDRARTLVNQILAFSRQHDRRSAPTDLRGVIAETTSILRATLPATVDLSADTPDDPVVADVDAGQIGQVVMNLAVNAADSLVDRRGRVTVDLTTEALAESGPGLPVRADGQDATAGRELGPGRLEDLDDGGVTLRTGWIAAGTRVARLTVVDGGSGIDRPTMERLFDPFFTTKPVGKGTGLGLATVYGIVAAHGGAIEVDSRPAHGTRFTVLLPLGIGDGRLPADPAAATALGPVPGRTARVLVVDDEPGVREMAARQLARAGFEVETAPDAVIALDRLDRAAVPPDVIVTDHAMPGMTGLDLARALAARGARPPIVLWTGNIDAADPGALAAVDAVLDKPALPGALAAAVQRLADRHRALAAE
jgi:PAS domain S-box-containing protein